MAEIRARVFISCGQQKDSIEVKVAQEIHDLLYDKGFDPYVAIQQQKLTGLRDDIFTKLGDSEYLLFIDFFREKLPTGEYRGSLFSHQELAIASYIQIDDVLAFQQKGMALEGMMKAMQLNPIPFDEPADLPKLVHEEIEKRGWSPKWKRILHVDRVAGEYQDAHVDTGNGVKLARYFHLTVENKHKTKIAINCTAYLESIVKMPENASVPLRTVELKWAGYTMPVVAIMPESKRDLDAFLVVHDEPHITRFNCYSDSSYYLPPILGQGEYILSYAVISENFPVARLKVKAKLGLNIDSISLEVLK
jgi:hypothetical protein